MRPAHTLFSLAATVVVVGLFAGCSASGYPGFVKFSQDGQRLILEDARYPRVYVYEPHSQHKTVFAGSVACLDQDVRRFILVPSPLGCFYSGPFPIPCSLVTMTSKGPALEHLPALPAGTKSRVIYIEFLPERKAIAARALENPWPKPGQGGGQFFVFTFGDNEWRQVDSSRISFPEFQYSRQHLPGGVRQGRYYYAPYEGDWGVDVQWANNGYEQTLNGPEHEYVVRINDHEDVWKRTTITQSATGNKQVILDKNDGVLDVLDGLLRILLYPLSPLMPKI